MDFLIDTDDVLAEFTPKIVPLISEILGRNWSPEELSDNRWDIFSALNELQFETLQRIIQQPGFCLSLEPTPGSKEMVAELRKHCDVFVVTAPNYYPNWVNERFEWLQEHFGFEKDRVINTHAKFQVQGDFFLDDHPKHVTEWAAKNPKGVALLWGTSANKYADYDGLRTQSWEDVLRHVRPYEAT